jgi:hypothetical protein
MFRNTAGITRFPTPIPPSILFSTSHRLLRPSSNIIDINNIRDILPYINAQTLVVCDLDLTLIRLTQSLGCDRWFDRYIVEQNKIHNDIKKAVEITLDLYTKIQKLSKVRTVEESTTDIIRELHYKVDSMLALTARDNYLQDVTIQQLDSIGISFNHGKHTDISEPLSQSDTSYAHQGIIFCAGKNKGDCLEEYLSKHLAYTPKHILFIDDKIKHINAVKDMCDRLGIDFLGLHYTHTHTEPEIDWSIAKKQLEVFLENGDLISDEEAAVRIALDVTIIKMRPAFA